MKKELNREESDNQFEKYLLRAFAKVVQIPNLANLT